MGLRSGVRGACHQAILAAGHLSSGNEFGLAGFRSVAPGRRDTCPGRGASQAAPFWAQNGKFSPGGWDPSAGLEKDLAYAVADLSRGIGLACSLSAHQGLRHSAKASQRFGSQGRTLLFRSEKVGDKRFAHKAH